MSTNEQTGPAGPVRVYVFADKTAVVADDGGWYPGQYANEEAARHAPHVDFETLERNVAWERRERDGVYQPVTLEEIQSWR